jgi:hypothetical protein
MNFPAIVRFSLLALFLSIPPAYADEDNDKLVEARNIFLQGVDGDQRAVRESIKRFRSLSADDPQNPVYMAYLGASMTLRGRDAPNNLDKQRFTEEGLRKVDQALSRLPKNSSKQSAAYLDTLLVAADTFVYIPAFFNRYEQGRDLLQVILDHRDFKNMAESYKAAVYFTAALIAHGDGDEKEYRRYLKLCAETDPEGRDGRSAKALLEQSD